MVKPFHLMLLLAFPVLIFVFFIVFAHNKYILPYYYEKGIKECGQLRDRHQVPSISFKDMEGNEQSTAQSDKFEVYCVADHVGEAELNDLLLEVEKIQDTYYEDKNISIYLLLEKMDSLSIAEAKLLYDKGLDSDITSISFLEKKDLSDYISCGLGIGAEEDTISSDKKFVLVDDQKMIRGIYDAAKKEETDRLILELKILLEHEEY